jgi:DNA-directed RNA polymerase specialized sigma24 family protein
MVSQVPAPAHDGAPELYDLREWLDKRLEGEPPEVQAAVKDVLESGCSQREAEKEHGVSWRQLKEALERIRRAADKELR